MDNDRFLERFINFLFLCGCTYKAIFEDFGAIVFYSFGLNRERKTSLAVTVSTIIR